MQCYEQELMLLHIQYWIADYSPARYPDKSLLLDILEQLEVNTYRELQEINGDFIRDIGRVHSGALERAA